MTPLKNHYFLIIILIFASILFSVNLNKPLVGHHDYNGVWHGTAAKNMARYGLYETRFASVMNTDYAPREEFQFYTHYPPLVPIFVYMGVTIFGEYDWAIRLTSMFFALTTIILIYILALKIFDKRVAVLAAAISSVLPLSIYFSKIPTHDLFVLPFILLSIIFYLDFFKKSSRNNFLMLAVFLILAHLTHWTGYYLSPLLSIHFLIFAKNSPKILIASLFIIISLIMLLSQLAHIFILTGSPLGGGLVDIFLGRLNLKDQPAGYSLVNFFKLQARYVTIYFTRPVVLLSVVALIWSIFQLKNRQNQIRPSVLLILAAFGASHILIFKNISFIHDYIIISLWPFLAIAASVGFFTVTKKITSSKFKILILGLILLTLISFERINYLKALLSSSSFQPGMTLGKIIGEKTASGQRTLVLSTDFKQYFEVFTNYYSDRGIDFEIPPEQTFLRKAPEYRLIVAIPSRDTPQNLIKILQKRYGVTTIEEFVIFDTNELKSQGYSYHPGI